MATPENDGGIGGKIRRRPFRRAAPTPYARPPTALRGVRGGGDHVAEGGGWISKLVDPASRLVANGASKLFSSVFRKRFTVPTGDSEADNQSREDVSQPTFTVPLSEVQNGGIEGDYPTNNPGSDGIAELERLFGQRTFTRVEFDRLAELLRSRTVEKVEHENNDKQKGKAGLSVPENGIGSSRINENHSVSRGNSLAKQIVKDEAASPAELAKAYVGSRKSKVLSSVGSLRNQVFQDDANMPSIPSTSKQLDLSVAPRSVIRFSGTTEHPEHGFQTARSARTPGRSAIYRMSRSPYFNVNPTTNIQVGESSLDTYSHSPLSRWTPGSTKSSGKQLLKRGIAALEDEFGSVGPIRRIRQKSNLMSPSKEAFSSLSGKYKCSPSTPSLKDTFKGSTSVQKPLLLDERNYSSVSQAENGISNSTMPPPQSSEKAHKLFQQLDKLLPSPKEKPSELKSIARDDSPSKLTLDMLHGRALRSTDEINSSNFFSMQENGTLVTAGDSQLSNIRNSHCQKLDPAEENEPSKSDGLEVKLTSEANGVSNVPTPSKNAMRGGRSENIAVSNSIALPAVKKPAFRMAAPEDLLELDDDDEYLPRPSTTPNDDTDTRKSKNNDVISETTVSDEPPTSSQSTPISSSLHFRKFEKKAFVQPVTEKHNGFVFPVTSDPCMQSQPPPTPTMPTLHLDKPDMQKEHTPSPIFSFRSQDVNTSTVSSTTISVNDTSGVNVGERSGSELLTAISVGTCNSGPTNLAEASTIDKSGKLMAGDTFNSSVDTVTSGMPVSSTPATFSFGAAASTGLSNGLLPASSSSTSPAPSTSFTTFSEGPVSSVLANNTFSSISSSASSAAATFSTASAIQFGSAMSTTAPVSISQPLNTSNSTTIGANSVKASPSSVFPCTGSSSLPDVATTVSIFSSISPSTSSSLFSSMTGSSSSVATSTASTSTESNLFSFNASSSIQSIGSSPSFATSSQNSTATVFGADGGPTAISFGATDGSVFGTQSKPPGTETSQMSQSSTSQFGSFTSSPSFGLVNSSSGSLAISPFGSATSASNHFTSSAGVAFSSSATSGSSLAPASTTGPFSVSSQATTSSIFAATSNSSTSVSTGLSFGSSASGSNVPPFAFGSSSSSSTSPFTGAPSSSPSSTSFTFGLSSGASISPFTGASSSGSSSTSFAFGLSTGSSTSPFTVGLSSGSSSSSFNFGALSGSSSSPFTMGSSSASSSSPFAFGSSSGSSGSPFVFGSSSGSVFSTSSSPAPAFGAQKPAFRFSLGSPGNDQMNVEDSMPDLTNNAPATTSFVFGAQSAPPVASPVFQFGGLQNPPVPQNPSPFQPAGNTDFNPGGTFSLGSGGGDKSARKFVKVKRGQRKK